MQRYDDARRALEEAVRRGGGTDPRVHTSLGVVSLLSGDLASAEASLATARKWFGERSPTPAWYHYTALAAGLAGDVGRASVLLQEGTTAYPRSAVLLNNLAAVLERIRHYDDARVAAEHGVQEDVGLAQLHKNLGDLHYRAARYDEAMESYLRATKASPELGGDVYLKLGNIRLRRNEREEAVRCWERALELDPQNAIVRTNLGAVRQVF